MVARHACAFIDFPLTKMLSFEWPWLFLLLPLPWLIRRVLSPANPPAGGALRVPFFDALAADSRRSPLAERRHWLWLGVLAWGLLVAAAARPQWLGELQAVPLSGRDIMLAVDLSRSMEQTDFEVFGEVIDRLAAVKRVATGFIDRRAGDRLGLIVFGERAYLQAPLTFDRTTVKTLLAEAAIGMAGDATAIGDAIGIAVKRLRGKGVENRVIILLTDGANTAGEIEPLKAATLAAKAGLRIHTIGIGADEARVRQMFGTFRVNPKLDLDETTLRAIAERTGGRYFRARDSDELAGIYRLIDEIEPVEQEPQQFRPVMALFPWPLAMALFLTVWLAFIRLRMVL
ncbi:MAG: vWA domain-containing protein [Chromatiales bacterium]